MLLRHGQRVKGPVAGAATVEACDRITAGPNLNLEDGADLTLRAVVNSAGGWEEETR